MRGDRAHCVMRPVSPSRADAITGAWPRSTACAALIGVKRAAHRRQCSECLMSKNTLARCGCASGPRTSVYESLLGIQAKKGDRERGKIGETDGAALSLDERGQHQAGALCDLGAPRRATSSTSANSRAVKSVPLLHRETRSRKQTFASASLAGIRFMWSGMSPSFYGSKFS